MAARVVDRRAKREKILRAAMTVLSRAGVHDFKMIDIAREAGIGKGTVYEYFSSKDEMIRGCLELFMGDWDQHMRSSLSEIDDPVSRLKSYFVTCFGFFEREHVRVKMLMEIWSAAVAPSGAEPKMPGVAQMYEQGIDYLAGIIDDGIARGAFRPVDSRAVAALMLSAVDGLMFQTMLGLDGIHLPDLAEKINTTFLQGIKA
jgi:TetR/AcrR family fatty acid metabolism transcriptional regulator